jgi:hypothetical protein
VAHTEPAFVTWSRQSAIPAIGMVLFAPIDQLSGRSFTICVTSARSARWARQPSSLVLPTGGIRSCEAPSSPAGTSDVRPMSAAVLQPRRRAPHGHLVSSGSHATPRRRRRVQGAAAPLVTRRPVLNPFAGGQASGGHVWWVGPCRARDAAPGPPSTPEGCGPRSTPLLPEHRPACARPAPLPPRAGAGRCAPRPGHPPSRQWPALRCSRSRRLFRRGTTPSRRLVWGRGALPTARHRGARYRSNHGGTARWARSCRRLFRPPRQWQAEDS